MGCPVCWQEDRVSPRLPIVGVMGSGSSSHVEKASRLGCWLAGRGVHLLTGGGGGVMAAVSRAFHEVPGRRGLVLGILPGEEGSVRPKPGYPNPWVEIPIFTHLPHSGTRGTDPLSRNHINILTSRVIVALPGSTGTASEARLAIEYGRPIVAYLDSPADIPGLDPRVQVRGDFEGVCDFVESHLMGRARESSAGSPR